MSVCACVCWIYVGSFSSPRTTTTTGAARMPEAARAGGCGNQTERKRLSCEETEEGDTHTHIDEEIADEHDPRARPRHMRLTSASTATIATSLLLTAPIHRHPRIAVPPRLSLDDGAGATNFSKLEPIPTPPPAVPSQAASELLASTLRVTTEWTDVAIGGVVFVLLHPSVSTASYIGAGASDAVAGKGMIEDAGAGALCRFAATAGFLAVQNAAGTWPTGLLNGSTNKAAQAQKGDRWWLGKESAILSSPSPSILGQPQLAAPLAAVGFALAVAGLGAALGVDLLPAPRPLPTPGRALDVSSRRRSQRSFLPRVAAADARACRRRLPRRWQCRPRSCPWHVPVIAAGNAAPGELCFFAILSLYLTVLYQRSAGSLPRRGDPCLVQRDRRRPPGGTLLAMKWPSK